MMLKPNKALLKFSIFSSSRFWIIKFTSSKDSTPIALNDLYTSPKALMLSVNLYGLPNSSSPKVNLTLSTSLNSTLVFSPFIYQYPFSNFNSISPSLTGIVVNTPLTI